MPQCWSSKPTGDCACHEDAPGVGDRREGVKEELVQLDVGPVLLEERHVVGDLEVGQDDVVEAVVVQRLAKRRANLTNQDQGRARQDS